MKFKSISIVVLAGAMSLATSAHAQSSGDRLGRSIIGTAIGAGLGGVLGSNLAGTGVQQEGTAIGAVVGGLLGHGISKSGQYRRNNGRYGSNVGSYGNGYGYNSGYYNAGYSSGMSAPSCMNCGGYAPQPMMPAPVMTRPMMPAPQYIQGGYVDGGSYTTKTETNYVYHPAPEPIVQTQRIIHKQPIIRKTIHVTQPQKIVRRTVHVVQPEAVNVVEYQQGATVYVDEPAETKYLPEVTMPAAQPQPIQPEQPILQQPQSGTYCYAGSSKRYDQYGRNIKGLTCN